MPDSRTLVLGSWDNNMYGPDGHWILPSDYSSRLLMFSYVYSVEFGHVLESVLAHDDAGIHAYIIRILN